MSQNHNDFSEHSTYSERVTERFVGKDVSATPSDGAGSASGGNCGNNTHVS